MTGVVLGVVSGTVVGATVVVVSTAVVVGASVVVGACVVEVVTTVLVVAPEVVGGVGFDEVSPAEAMKAITTARRISTPIIALLSMDHYPSLLGTKDIDSGSQELNPVSDLS